MAAVDAQKVIDKLGVRLANSEVQRAVAETQLEDAVAQLAAARKENAELRAALTELAPAAPQGD